MILAKPSAKTGWALLALLLAGLAPRGWLSAAPTDMPASAEWAVTDLEGRHQIIRIGETTPAVVFCFLSTECPIANRVQPELARLEREFTPQGVRFIAVYPNAGETASAIRQARADSGNGAEAVLDSGQKLATALGVTVTPEVVVLTADGALVYQGRVNDQYAGLGQGRPAPTRHDLERALREFLASGTAAGVKTKAAGCRLQKAP